ncbi:hypothetical protein R50073_42820 [Maricurvus nonylphenolicus]|uniref:TFIIB-type zinc ribbon-containing protein n=1 Tax=Maricurvus nonylphenolicus TaxID=1008307 RepID=UPI0036F35246
MDCPQCKGYRLEPKELEAGLLGAGCNKCEGVMLPLMNYRYWQDQNPVVDNIFEDIVIEDSEQAKTCPKCSRFMSRFQVGVDTANRIDMCTGCDEAWLDKGEWQLLKQLDLHDRLPKIFTDAWQRNIRLKKQENTQKERFQELLGESDFSKVDDFKQWLDQHPEKHQIRLFLQMNFNN